MSSEPDRKDASIRTLREDIEKAVLACQLAGSRLDPGVDRALFSRPAHHTIQAVIDELRAESREADILSVTKRLAPDPEQMSGDVLAWLRALPVALRQPGADATFDAEFAKLLAQLKMLERRQTGGLAIVEAHTLVPEEIGWLWNGWLARGKLHLLAGNVGAGKTTLALSLAATITSGGQFPDGRRAKQGSVLFWSGDDDPGDFILPRFLACGGDRTRLVLPQSMRDRTGQIRRFDPSRDLAALGFALCSVPDLAMLVIDPFDAIAASNSSARRSLGALLEIAAGLGIAVLGISHLSRSRQNQDPLSRVLGRHAFIATARLVMVTATGADGRPLLLRAKSNIGPDKDGFGYALEPREVAPGVTGMKVAWAAPVVGSAEALHCPSELSSRLYAAREWLAAQLTAGGAPSSDLKAQAGQAGHSWITMLRAKRLLGAKSVKLDTGEWRWALPVSRERTLSH